MRDMIDKIPRHKAIVWCAICHVSVERMGSQFGPMCGVSEKELC